jgi:hypothetical protein
MPNHPSIARFTLPAQVYYRRVTPPVMDFSVRCFRA